MQGEAIPAVDDALEMSDAEEEPSWTVVQDEDMSARENDSHPVDSPLLLSTPPRTLRPIPGETDEIRQRDYFDDRVLEEARPTRYRELSGHLPVDELLLVPVPSGCLSSRPNVAELLSTEEPTTWPVHTAAPLHEVDICVLENLKYEAWRDRGVRSIQSPSKAGVRWPLWVLDFWRSQARIRDAKVVWRDAITYLGEEIRKFERKVEWNLATGGGRNVGELKRYQDARATFASTLTRVHNIGWSAGVSTYNGSLDTLRLGSLLGEKWTHADVLDSAVVLLQRRLPSSTRPFEARIVETDFSRRLLLELSVPHAVFPPKCKTLEAAGRWLKAGKDTGVDRRLFAIGHINGNHWIAITVFSDGRISYGDSLEVGADVRGTQWWRRNASAYSQFATLAGLRDIGSSYDVQRMTIAYQNSGVKGNSWDCGVCAVNAIAHAIYDDELWTPIKSSRFRVQMFLEGVDMGKELEMESDESDSNSEDSDSEVEGVAPGEADVDGDIEMTDVAAQDLVTAPTSTSHLQAASVPPAAPSPPSPVPRIHAFFSGFGRPPAAASTSNTAGAKGKKRNREGSVEDADGQIDPHEEPIDDPATRRSKAASGPRKRVAATEKTTPYQNLLEAGVLMSYDAEGFVCLCTPKKSVSVLNFKEQPLKLHLTRKKHIDWVKSRASSRMLRAKLSEASSTPKPASKISASNARAALLSDPTAAPCASLTLSQPLNTSAYALQTEGGPRAACTGLQGKKYAPLFNALSDFGGLGANYHRVYGMTEFRWKAWDGRPKSKWETNTQHYQRLPMLPSWASRAVAVSDWSAEEKRKYTRELKRQAVWHLERVQETVRASACTLSMAAEDVNREGVCSACKALRKNPTFQRARKESFLTSANAGCLPNGKTLKEKAGRVGTQEANLYTSLPYRRPQNSPSKISAPPRRRRASPSPRGRSREPYVKLQAFAARGLLKGKEIMVALIECLVQKVEIEQSDNPKKQKHRIRYVQDVIDFSILVRARGGTSAAQYAITASQLPLPHPRTVKRATAKRGMGFALSGTDTARIDRYWDDKIAKKLDHHPVVIMQDCTKANPALTHTRTFADLCANGHIVGSTLELSSCAVIDEPSPAAITAKVKAEQAIATQVRAILVKLPLDGDPGLVIHLSPTDGTSTGEGIFALTDEIRRQLSARGARVVASAADGAATELRAQDLSVSNHAGDFVVYDNAKYDLHLRAPVYEDSGPMVSVQDAGHAKKTGRNNAVGGATFLVLGRCWAGFTNILSALVSGISGLISTDVLKTDKQDDAAARRLMLPPVLRACLNPDGSIIEEQRGLFGYLTMLGEIFDAWFNRTMSIDERLKICFRGLHFLRNWRRDVVRLSQLYPGLYSTTRSFLSTGANRILLRQCESLILLIISYRDYYPSTPFCPWQISSAPLEHWFGLCRQLDREFTIGGLFEMVKNVDLRHHILSSGRFTGPKERSGRRGYDHQVDSEPMTPEILETLRTFPDKLAIDHIADAAWEEMATMNEWLGIPVPLLPLLPTTPSFTFATPAEPQNRADVEDWMDWSVDVDHFDEGDEPPEEDLPDVEDEDEVEVAYEYPLDPDAVPASLSQVEDFGPAITDATTEMIARVQFRELLEREAVTLEKEEAEMMSPEVPIVEALTVPRPTHAAVGRRVALPKPENSFSSRTDRALDIEKVIVTRSSHIAGTNVQKERAKGPDSLLANPVVLTNAGLVRPNVISNALRVAQEETEWNKGSRVTSRHVRWAGTAKQIKAAAVTQFMDIFGTFTSQLLDTRGVTKSTPLAAGSWVVCRNPGSNSHAAFWYIAQNVASFTKTDRAGKYSHAETITLAETIACMHVKVYKQIASSTDGVDLEEDVFRHAIKRRAYPLNIPLGGQLPPGRDSLLTFVSGADFVFKFDGECFVPTAGDARQLTPVACKIWKTFNAVQVGTAFVHAIEADDQLRIDQRKEKARLNKEAKAEALRELDTDGKAEERKVAKKKAAAEKKAAKAAAPKTAAEEAVITQKKAKAAATKAAKAASAPALAKAAKAAAKHKETWLWSGTEAEKEGGN
ncbi:hypothetical protein P7C70_g4639, partial [Phenoliferia sp. Uapishka_3]